MVRVKCRTLSSSPHPFQLSKTPYFLITCYFSIWLRWCRLRSGSSNQYLLNHVQRIQNSCLYFSYCVRKYDHISPYYQRSGWLKICQRFYFLPMPVFSLFHSNIPLYLLRLFQLNSEHNSTFNPFVIGYQDYLSFSIHWSIKFRAAFFYTLNILILFLIQ